MRSYPKKKMMIIVNHNLDKPKKPQKKYLNQVASYKKRLNYQTPIIKNRTIIIRNRLKIPL